MSRERDQVLRSLYPEPSDTERFYARALGTLSGPRRVLRTTALVVNLAVYSLWLGAAAFVGEQAWDRSQPPFEIRSTIARPQSVIAGQPVHVVVDVERYRRCTYDVTWSVTDALHRVVAYGPVERRAPGGPGPDTYSSEYTTPSDAAPGPAVLRVSLRGECDSNYLDDWFPRTIDMPAVPFEVLPAPKP